MEESLKKAKKEVIIVSPFLRKESTEDKWNSLIQQTKRRGVDVTIYANYSFHYRKDRQVLDEARDYLFQMRKNGLEPVFLEQIHNKTLIVDDEVIAEGSFNWFSAVRNSRSQHHNYEATIVLEGEAAKPLIHRFKKKLKTMPVNPV